jgi:hypothetical protein
MRNFSWKIFGLLLFAAAPAWAQFTTVSGTVQDANGIPYANGTITAKLTPATPGGYRLSGQPYSGTLGLSSLDSTGSFTLSMADNTQITPAGSQWSFTVCSNPGGIPPPLGTGNQCFGNGTAIALAPITITGGTQSISAQLQAVAPSLTNFGGGGGIVTNVVGVSPIASTGGATPNVSCPTCVTAAGGGTVALLLNQVGYGIGTNQVGGNNNFTNDATTLTYNGTGGMVAGSGYAATSDGVHAGKVSLFGNTAFYPLVANSYNMAGPPSATYTAWWDQAATSTSGGPAAPSVKLYPTVSGSPLVSAWTFAALQGTDAKILSAGTVAGTGASLCTDAQGGATTSGCPSSGGGSFSAITAGTNAAALLVGTGGSLAPSGTGTITANLFPVSAGCATTANGQICQDSTQSWPHVWGVKGNTAAADHLFMLQQPTNLDPASYTNGSTTCGVQEAINALLNAAQVGGQINYHGICTTSTQIVIRGSSGAVDAVRLIGDGPEASIINYTGTGTTGVIIVGGSGYDTHQVVISGINISCNGALGCIGINAIRTKQLTITNNLFDNGGAGSGGNTSACIVSDGGATFSALNDVENNRCVNGWKDGIRVTGSGANEASNNNGTYKNNEFTQLNNPAGIGYDFQTGSENGIEFGDVTGYATAFHITGRSNYIAPGLESSNTTCVNFDNSVWTAAANNVLNLFTGPTCTAITDTGTNNNIWDSGTTGIKSARFTSTVATGTAPFTVASTTNVANLNASSLAGATFAAPGAIGGTTPSTGTFTTLSATGAITSTLATGTAPFTVASTTPVANLAINAAGVPAMPVPYGTGAGSVNVMTVTTVPAVATNAAGTIVAVLPNLANTTATPTLNVGGAGAMTITRFGQHALVSSDYTTTAIAYFVSDGTRWQLQNPQNAVMVNNTTLSGNQIVVGGGGTGHIIATSANCSVSGSTFLCGLYGTSTNCSSSASPAVCAAAPAGSVALPTGTNPTLVVNTTAVTANSQIMLTVDESLGTKLSVTCNTTLSTLVNPVVTARTAGTSFTFTIGAVIASNPACVSYSIIN